MPEEKNQLEELEEGIEKIEEKMGLNDAAEIADLSDDLVNQMKAAQTSIRPIPSVFTFPLGTEVKTRSDEIGYIEICAIDFRGEIYLVHFKSDNSSWYSPAELKRIDTIAPYHKDPVPPAESKPKTDFPEELNEGG